MAAPNQTSSTTLSRPTASSKSSTSTLIIPATAPAGGLTITNPPQTATSYFKIAASQPVTFGWNFTYLLATPTHLTVSAVCENGNTYPVGPTNGIIPGTATQVVWDLYAYQQAHPNNPLAQASYSLTIWDDRGPTAVRRPGYLQQNSALQFALYTPEAYTPLASGWTCSACTSAASHAAHPASVSLLVTFFLIFFSGFYLIRSSSRSTQA